MITVTSAYVLARRLAAGGVLFRGTGAGWSVIEISNQSAGYCPDPDSWPALARTPDRLGLAHPGGFTHNVVFRRCPACGQPSIVRESDFACAVCDSPLPAQPGLVDPADEGGFFLAVADAFGQRERRGDDVEQAEREEPADRS